MKKLRILLQYKYVYILLTIVILIYSICITNFVQYKSKYNINITKINGYIHNINIDGNKLNIEIIGEEKLIGNYYFKTQKEKDTFNKKYKLGDYINVVGKLVIPNNNTVFNLFNYKKYLKQNNIHYVLNIEKISKYKDNNKLRYKVKQLLINRIETITKSKRYLYAFILGDDYYISDEIKKSYQLNGISHLFAISGDNISFLVLIIMSVLKKVKIKYFIIFFFLYYYMFLTNFCPSIVRAGIFFILLSINKMLKLNIKIVNILLLTLCVALLFNPYLMYDIGFQFSFIISLYLISFQKLITRYKSKLWNLFMVSLIAFLSSIPIVLNNFFQLNLLSIIFNLLFVPFVSLLLFPLSLLCFVFPFFDTILSVFIYVLECSSLFFSKVNIFSFIIGKPSVIILLLYYAVITYVLLRLNNKQYRSLLLILILLIVNYNIGIFNKYPEVTFIDIGQGDSILIKLPHNEGNILIDTGGKLTYDIEKWEKRNNMFSLGSDVIVSYLKSEGVKHIDYLILTHGDYDHMGEAVSIIENIKIRNVVFNKDNINETEKMLINKLKDININYSFVQERDIIKIRNYKFFILNPHVYSDENSDSIVIYTTFNNKNILFTGDANINVENYLINKYNLKVDILKVGHHGSKTSTGENFIRSISPKYAIISVGLNNKFGHPSANVIDLLDKYNVKKYLTSTDGSIKFIFGTNDVTIIKTGT